MHPVPIELEFVEPVGAVRCLLNQLGKLRFDPGGRRSRSNRLAGENRARDITRDFAMTTNQTFALRPCVMSWTEYYTATGCATRLVLGLSDVVVNTEMAGRSHTREKYFRRKLRRNNM